MWRLFLVLASLAALSACASRGTPPAPACRGDVSPLNAAEPTA